MNILKKGIRRGKTQNKRKDETPKLNNKNIILPYLKSKLYTRDIMRNSKITFQNCHFKKIKYVYLVSQLNVVALIVAYRVYILVTSRWIICIPCEQWQPFVSLAIISFYVKVKVCFCFIWFWKKVSVYLNLQKYRQIVL